MELTLDRLTRQFGARIAVDRVSATLTPGVIGLLGANGAGKTTLMRMVCDVLRPTGGQILLDGRDAFEMGDEYRALLGYLPQDFGCYPDFSALDFMRYMATLKGFGNRDGRERSMRLLEEVGLAKDARRKIKTFSGGMRQRLGIAQAMINDPHILVLDEPTAGLDPRGRAQLEAILANIHAHGVTTVRVTHSMEDAATAQQVIVLSQAHVLMQGTPEEVFSLDNEKTLHDAGLGLPAPLRWAKALGLDEKPLTKEALLTALCKRLGASRPDYAGEED
jgi:ABC-2 type transport system ATP-binding protein